jgi:hypothetical protein
VSRLLARSLEGQAVVLDVGGRVDLLGRFTRYQVVTLNVDGTADLLYDGRSIPFAANAFDSVITIDTLEHLPQAQRLSFLQECLRVARVCLIIAAPYGSESHIAREKELDDLYRSEYGYSHVYLGEHVQYGLPTPEEVDQLVEDLEVADAEQVLAGDYRWQARQFELALHASRRQGWGGRLQNVVSSALGLALFHPIRLRHTTYPSANRFYLQLWKMRPPEE